jgi:hypothetical protein
MATKQQRRETLGLLTRPRFQRMAGHQLFGGSRQLPLMDAYAWYVSGFSGFWFSKSPDWFVYGWLK